MRKLHSVKGREESGLFLAEGEKAVAELLLSPIEVKTVYYLSGYAPVTNRATIGFFETSEAEMQRISQFHSPSPIAAVGVIPKSPAMKGNRLLYLDHISDPGNAGTIIRLCHWFGIDSVLMSENCVDGWNPKLVQASMGSVFNVNVVQQVTTENLQQLAAQGYIITGTHLKGNDIGAWKPAEKCVLVVGNESQGISPEVEKLCTSLVRIPGAGTAESLNVATATAIFLYEWNNKRG